MAAEYCASLYNHPDTRKAPANVTPAGRIRPVAQTTYRPIGFSVFERRELSGAPRQIAECSVASAALNKPLVTERTNKERGRDG